MFAGPFHVTVASGVSSLLRLSLALESEGGEETQKASLTSTM